MFFETADGTRLAYEDYGQGRPIVFVTSSMLNTEMWEYQIPFFVEQGFRCVSFDRRGHGRSDRPSTGYDIDTLADDLAAFLDHLDLRDVIFVAHSLGGAEVARYLGRHGEDRVERAVFVAAILPFLKQTDDNPEGVPEAALHRMLARIRADRPKWLTTQSQAFFATQLGTEASPAVIDWTIRMCLSASPWATQQVQQTCYHADNREHLRRLTIPTLVVHGDADASAVVQVTGRRTAALIPGTIYKEYPAAGHGLYITHKDQLNADILDFIKS
ncbi:hydrolase [Streptomyces bingchenggensis BCW-1]|uniref:Hydrolase n=1 Tax=Streptomyces bingchenggensis (strain BCW-1) TaxID=749414 RepID=D7BXR5_STRBB|nr:MULTISPECIES: alpha/beta hydrolase [Streptomyces]ADI09813.1 hydrolase [Streptomyces bingchenggensis BCW-1]